MTALLFRTRLFRHSPATKEISTTEGGTIHSSFSEDTLSTATIPAPIPNYSPSITIVGGAYLTEKGRCRIYHDFP